MLSNEDYLAETLTTPALREELTSIEGAIRSARRLTDQRTLRLDFSDRRIRYSAEERDRILRCLQILGHTLLSREDNPDVQLVLLRDLHSPSY